MEFRAAHVAQPSLGQRLAAEFGEVNLHVRGMLHVVDLAARPAVVANLAALLGSQGTAYVCETDVSADPLEHLLFQGATPTWMPDVLRRWVVAGVRAPSHFGPDQVAEYFPEPSWHVLANGPTVMYGVPLRRGDPLLHIPSYLAVLKR